MIAVSALLSRNFSSGRPSASAQIWAYDRIGALADIDGALVQDDIAGGEMPTLMVDGLGSEVLRSRTSRKRYQRRAFYLY